jgi:hypothetical protein
VSVQAQDGSGNPAGGFSGTVTITDSAGHFSPTSITVVNSSGTISATANFSGPQTLTASSSLPTITLPINMSEIITNFVVTTLTGGGPVQAGQAFLVQARASDAFGNFVTTYPASAPSSVNVTATPTPGAGTSSFPFTMSIDSTGLGIGLGFFNLIGNYTISVADPSGTFTATAASPVVVVPGPAAKLAFAAQPVNTPTGDVLPPVTVQVEDAFGNLITSDNGDPVTLGIASGPGSFTADSTTTATVVGGVATFKNLKFSVPGSYSLSAVVPAKYIGPNSSSFSVQPLQVVPGWFAGSPSGFSVTFNAPFLVNSTTPTLYGSGFGATAAPPTVTVTGMATGTATIGGGMVTGVIITSSVLYTSPPSVTFTSGGGTGARATAILKNGGTDPQGDPVIGVTINNQGSGYAAAPAVTFSGVQAAGTVS